MRAAGRSRLTVAAAAVLGLLLCVALLADLLASDLPVVLRFRGELYLLPSVTRPAALREHDNHSLRLAMGADDWAWMPLCEYGPVQQPPIRRPPPASPDARHWLGTDDRGRDVLARLIHGTRVSLAVGLCSVAINVLLGLALGLCGGYFRGRVDLVVSRLIELGLTFPTFFLILVVMALLDRASVPVLILVLGLTRWTDVARLVRAEALRLRELDFVTAARAAGAGNLRIIWRHILPHATGPVLVSATFGVGGAIVAETALSFLGFGTPPPTASWGEVLAQGFEFQNRWWLVLCPGALLFVTVTSLNLVGEGLRDRLGGRP
jgi:peptide/nickel transport system permease protein